MAECQFYGASSLSWNTALGSAMDLCKRFHHRSCLSFRSLTVPLDVPDRHLQRASLVPCYNGACVALPQRYSFHQWRYRPSGYSYHSSRFAVMTALRFINCVFYGVEDDFILNEILMIHESMLVHLPPADMMGIEDHELLNIVRGPNLRLQRS